MSVYPEQQRLAETLPLTGAWPDRGHEAWITCITTLFGLLKFLLCNQPSAEDKTAHEALQREVLARSPVKPAHAAQNEKRYVKLLSGGAAAVQQLQRLVPILRTASSDPSSSNTGPSSSSGGDARSDTKPTSNPSSSSQDDDDDVMEVSSTSSPYAGLPLGVFTRGGG